ncbi:MAG: hypothetical protein COV59_02650 [Candidatus Magasanikbacteria bacterium CG11_big_fil_rev_8_21_14_0_20_39_34]|uniref:Uncharacterized protein n=1 Tax=Candidatus Magasanikbacteria bacterium CG11_big_fil_rev_8_21_14_0_20_39_34 TaxID=1974653 RepID=A0A2H0N572_9BACT|nr:MAG: hypothetical protein COV59_02650 [Candidatus Magasanikbacteria bacterium CG11_big_fil_rev_8_21_14_0_20_39_34]
MRTNGPEKIPWTQDMRDEFYKRLHSDEEVDGEDDGEDEQDADVLTSDNLGSVHTSARKYVPKKIPWTQGMKRKFYRYLYSDDADSEGSSEDDLSVQGSLDTRDNEKLQNQYDDLLKQYRKLMERVKALEEEGSGRDAIAYIDSFRNSVHNELKAAGRKLGKGESAVNCEILASQENLDEYGLPEFHLIPIGTHKKSYVRAFGDEQKIISVPEDAFVLPFLTEVSWRLYENSYGFFQKSPYMFELQNRMQEVSEKLGVPCIELYLPETQHKGIRFVGLQVNADNWEQILSYLRTHRQESSIDAKFMDADRIAKDWEMIVRDMCIEIDEYMRSEESHGYGITEDRDSLLEDWLRSIAHDGDPKFFTPEKLEETRQLANNIMKEFTLRKELSKLHSQVDEYSDYGDQYEGLPKRKGAHRGK